MLDVVDGLFEENADMRVVQGVDRPAAGALAGDEPQVPQHAQLMGYGRLFHLDRHREFANRAGRLAQTRQDADTTWRRQRLHRLGHLPRRRRIDSRRRRLPAGTVTHKQASEYMSM